MSWAMAGAMLGSALIGASQQNKAAKMAAAAARGRDRNYLKEMQTAIDSQATIQPQLLGLERQYIPEWQQLEADMLGQQMSLSELIQRQALSGSGQMSMDYARQMDPFYGYVGESAMKNYKAMLGARAANLQESILRKSEEDFKLGRELSEEQKSNALQAARQAAQARGMQFGNQAAVLEALYLDSISSAREEERRQRALQALALESTQSNIAWDRYGQPMMQQAAFASPAMRLGLAQQMQATAGPKVFQPESQYSAGVYGANTQNQTSAALAAAQIKAGQGAGLMSMVGNLGAGYLSNENVKFT